METNESPTLRIAQVNAGLQSLAEEKGHKQAFWAHGHSTTVHQREPNEKNRYNPLHQETRWDVTYWPGGAFGPAVAGTGKTLHQAYENLKLNMQSAPSMDEQLVGV